LDRHAARNSRHGGIEPEGGGLRRRNRSLVSIEDVGVATAFLAHDAARLITCETLYIDGGYHIID
jgi:NAD(P)-dependent dehydrogenase (short-subunit alcohol dehydrogenase family)